MSGSLANSRFVNSAPSSRGILQVGHDDVGSQVADDVEGPLPVGALSDDLDVGLGVQQLAQPEAHVGVVVDDHDADHPRGPRPSDGLRRRACPGDSLRPYLWTAEKASDDAIDRVQHPTPTAGRASGGSWRATPPGAPGGHLVPAQTTVSVERSPLAIQLPGSCSSEGLRRNSSSGSRRPSPVLRVITGEAFGPAASVDAGVMREVHSACQNRCRSSPDGDPRLGRVDGRVGRSPPGEAQRAAAAVGGPDQRRAPALGDDRPGGVQRGHLGLRQLCRGARDRKRR
jgi:hypothetical protein